MISFLGFVGIVIIFLPLINNGENSMVGVMAIMEWPCCAVGSLINQCYFQKQGSSLEAICSSNIIQSLVSCRHFVGHGNLAGMDQSA